MSRKIGTFAAAAALGLALCAGGANAAEVAAVSGLERVDSIPALTRPHSWHAIDDDTVIVWATPFDPYLVELAFRSPDLKFTEIIGITQVGSRIYAKFDAVKVRGFRYPIESIYKMTREEARNLTRGT